MLNIPAQRVTINVEVHRDWRRHGVALQIKYILHGDVDVCLLHHVVGLLDVHIQLVAVGHETVVQVVKLGIAHHWCIEVACCQGIHLFVGHQRVAACHHLALRVDITLDADAGRLQVLLVVVLLLRASEVKISHQSIHRTYWGVVRILVNKVNRQHALKHTNLVNVSSHHVSLVSLINEGGTQCDVVA